MLFSCKDHTSAKYPPPDLAGRKFLLNLDVYYGQVKSIEQILEENNEREEDIIENFEWSVDGRIVKNYMGKSPTYYTLSFLDSSLRLDSIVFYDSDNKRSNNIFYKVKFLKDYFHYQADKAHGLDTSKIEIDTINRVIKVYHKNDLYFTDYFDTAGFLVKSVNIRGSVTTYEYNDHGFCSLAYTTFADKKVGYRKVESSYEYDSIGNWIKKVNKNLLTDVGIEDKAVWRRKIVYSE